MCLGHRPQTPDEEEDEEAESCLNGPWNSWMGDYQNNYRPPTYVVV